MKILTHAYERIQGYVLPRLSTLNSTSRWRRREELFKFHYPFDENMNKSRHDVEIQIWTWGTFSDLRNGFLGLWVKQGWHRPLPSKRIIVRFNIYFLTKLIISHLMVDETSTVPCHAGERLVRELGGLPQSPDQLDQLDVISTLKISYFCKKST